MKEEIEENQKKKKIEKIMIIIARSRNYKTEQLLMSIKEEEVG